MLKYTSKYNIRVVSSGNLLVFKYVFIDFAIPNLMIIKTAFKTSFPVFKFVCEGREFTMDIV